MRKFDRPVPVLLERDDNYPAQAELLLEVERLDVSYARARAGSDFGSRARGPASTREVAQ